MDFINYVNFEKSKDPKESLTIGQSAIPILIGDMYMADKTIDGVNPIKEGSANISRKDIHRLLKSISKEELVQGWSERYYVGIIVKEEEKEKGISQTFIKIHPLSDFFGCYLEIDHQKYKIPKDDV